MQRWSEPYQATGGLAAEGVLNQLGRPDIEPLEVLIREAVQNCWDARREARSEMRIEIGRRTIDDSLCSAINGRVLPDPPPGLPLADELRSGARLLHIADFGTSGLGGPTRADRASDDELRDFVDFIRNIGQPPDKDLGGGSFGYGKAAFYLASRARTVIVDTLCATDSGLERRLIAAALGANYSEEGRTYTGRHWWGDIVDGVPEPVTGDRAAEIATLLGLPSREGPDELGTTVAIVAAGFEPNDDVDLVMPFIVGALMWNFWPKMVPAAGGRPAIVFALSDDGQSIPIPDPRTDLRLRGFVDAMDRLRSDPRDEEDDPTIIDRRVAADRSPQYLGRIVVQKGPVPSVTADPELPMPRGMRETLRGVHHVALMRNAELVVKYQRGPEAVTGRFGYSGVFRCSLDTDKAFRDAEPPTHDDWVVRSMAKGAARTFVSVALRRVDAVCREAAGLTASGRVAAPGEEVPLGEFSDELARLMPGFAGPGARSAPRREAAAHPRRRRNSPGTAAAVEPSGDEPWVESGLPNAEAGAPGLPDQSPETETTGEAPRTPQMTPALSGSELSGVDSPARRPIDHVAPLLRVAGDPVPWLRVDGEPVLRYPFEVRAKGNDVTLSAAVRVMTNDGESVERDPPRGWVAPEARAWIAPDGVEYLGASVTCSTDRADGAWFVELPITEDGVLGVEISAVAH